MLTMVGTGAQAQFKAPPSDGFTAKMAEGTADADKWTVKIGDTTESTALPLTGIAEGQTVTLTYTGTKRVKSVTATKGKYAEKSIGESWKGTCGTVSITAASGKVVQN